MHNNETSDAHVQSFYDGASQTYSQKRYGGVVDSYVKYFFKKRLNILLTYIHKALAGRDRADLLEVGCADGIVIRKIDDRFPGKFRKMVGVDIAPKMINEAISKNKKNYISFFVRNDTMLGEYDFILEVGFLSADLFEKEFSFVKDHLNENGYYICSLAGKHSLHHIFKQNIEGYYPYEYYEKRLREHFEIIHTEPYGLFVPKLWSVPIVARVVQPLLEGMCKYVVPGLFHEQMYLLKKKKASPRY